MAKENEEQDTAQTPKTTTSSSYLKNISFPFNTAFLIINSIFFTAASFWFVAVSTFHYKSDACNRFVTTSGIFISFSILSMSAAGFYAAYYKLDCLFRIYLYMFFLWMFVLVAKAIVVFYLEKETNPRLFPGTLIQEYRFEDYSGWVRRLVIKEDEWYRIRRCLVKDNVCNKLFTNQNMSASEFYEMNLTPIQSGCCKPPLSCGLKFEKPNIWTGSKYDDNVDDDCKRWNNSEDTLCFNCYSCKAVTIANLHHTSFSFSFNLFHIIFSLSLGLIGWFAWLRSLAEISY